jgi:hypothetical protein|nr:MAG TPA: hypothetical protein [Caudoviricetes sp.]
MTRRIIHEELTDVEKFDNYLKEYNIGFFGVLTLILRNSFVAKLYRKIMIPAHDKGYLNGLDEDIHPPPIQEHKDFDKDVPEIHEKYDHPERVQPKHHPPMPPGYGVPSDLRIHDRLECRIIGSYPHMEFKEQRVGDREYWKTTFRGNELTITRVDKEFLLVEYKDITYKTPFLKVNDLLELLGQMKIDSKIGNTSLSLDNIVFESWKVLLAVGVIFIFINLLN